MLILPKIARSSRDNMESTFKAEIASVPADELPLDQGMRHASVATDNASGEAVGAMVIATEIDEHVLRLRAGLFFTSVIAGCACTDDPTPMNDEPEYCEVEFEIDRGGGRPWGRPGVGCWILRVDVRPVNGHGPVEGYCRSTLRWPATSRPC
ncbi:MAG: hypothetical protein ABR561_07095 [Guyparkeria sp.]